MPFISIELSQNITFALEPFAKSLHAYLAPVLGVGIEKLKSKKVIVSDYVLGDGSHDTTYVRLKLELKQGRRPEVLKTVLDDRIGLAGHEKANLGAGQVGPKKQAKGDYGERSTFGTC